MGLVRFTCKLCMIKSSLLFLLRPVDDEGNRITPDRLRDHRISHVFRGPCCLCAHTAGTLYSECIIYMSVEGVRVGEYIAACATERCGYLGAYVLSNC